NNRDGSRIQNLLNNPYGIGSSTNLDFMNDMNIHSFTRESLGEAIYDERGSNSITYTTKKTQGKREHDSDKEINREMEERRITRRSSSEISVFSDSSYTETNTINDNFSDLFNTVEEIEERTNNIISQRQSEP